jgi:hypothetical protein
MQETVHLLDIGHNIISLSLWVVADVYQYHKL